MTKYAIHTKWSWPNGVPSAETMQARHRELRSKTKAKDIIWFKIDENTHQSVIIFSSEDKITEGGASNIFFSKGNEIFTPSLEENILPGVTRDFIINALRSENISVKEQDCYVSQLDQASTVWFTSSTKGIQPVEKIVNANYTRDTKDEVFRKASLIFSQSIEDYLSKT